MTKNSFPPIKINKLNLKIFKINIVEKKKKEKLFSFHLLRQFAKLPPHGPPISGPLSPGPLNPWPKSHLLRSHTLGPGTRQLG